MNSTYSHLPCTTLADRAFGPLIQCRQFDFTLTFEQTLLAITTSLAFLLLFPIRIKQIYRSEIIIRGSLFYKLKIVGIVTRLGDYAYFLKFFSILNAAIQIACLVLWSTKSITRVSIELPPYLSWDLLQ